MKIRRGRATDGTEIVRLWRILMASHAELHPDLYRLADNADETYLAFVRRQRTDDRGVLFVAESDTGLLGYVLGGVGRRSPCYAVRDIGMIFDLVVDPADRRGGVGRALVDAASVHFRGLGLQWQQVNFSPDNPTASAFWPALGFDTLLCEAYRAES